MKIENSKIFKQKNVSSTSNGHFLYSLLPKDSLRAKIEQIITEIAVRAMVGSLETFTAATRYNMIRTISSNPYILYQLGNSPFWDSEKELPQEENSREEQTNQENKYTGNE